MAEARDHLEQVEALLREAGVLPPENLLQDDTKREELEREIRQLTGQIRAAQQVDRSQVATTTREDRERAAGYLINGNPITADEEAALERWYSGADTMPDVHLPARFVRIAQAIATARAEGEAKGRAELGATLVRDLGAMATSLAGQSDGDTAAALKAQAEATQREAVHLALIAELADEIDAVLWKFGGDYPGRFAGLEELAARARDATRNVRVIELGECEVKHAILYLGDTATPVLSPDNGAIDRAEAAALEGASGPCTAAVVVRMGGDNA